MKFTKKMAAMIAGMMTIAAMGGMTAFADSQSVASDHYTDDDNPKTATVDLQAKVSSTTTSTSTGANDPNADDTGKHIWAVTISADTLTWDLVRNDNTAYKQNITWNPSTHTYVVENGDVDTANSTSTYSVASTDTAAKTVNVANNSNFAITSATTTAAPASGSAYGATFTVTNPTGEIDIGGNADTTITIDVSNMTGFDSTSYVSVGTATITLTATGDIQTRS